MTDLPATLRLAYHASQPYPRDVPLPEVYLDLTLPRGVGDRPFVYVNMVQTLDGQAVLQGTAYAIGSAVDHYLLRQLRGHADAVLYGAGTLRADDVIVTTHPALQERRAREGRTPNPLAIVATGTAEFSDDVLRRKQFFRRTDFPRLVVTTPRATARAVGRVRDAGVEVEVVDAGPRGEVDLPALLRRLRARGVDRLLGEGGPVLNVSLARARALDELFVTTALRLGGQAAGGRIFAEPVTDRRLTLISEFHSATPDGVQELYLRLRFPG